MNKEDILVNYRSQGGEKIRVVGGPVPRFRCENNIRVYVGGKIRENFDSFEVSNSVIPLIKGKLEELAEGCADSDELISAIYSMLSDFHEKSERRIDEECFDIDTLRELHEIAPYDF